MIDGPPLFPVTDAALLAAQADGALVVVRHGKTTKDQLSHALERVAAVDAKTLGVVVNMAAPKKSNSAYGYGYSYASRDDSDLTDGSGKPKRAGHQRGRRRLRW